MRLTWIEDLIRQYNAEVRQLDDYRRRLEAGKTPQEQEEAVTVSGMLSDMRYALDWMRRGRRPGSRRGAEQRDVYRRRELIAKASGMVDRDEHRHLIDCVAVMTERELTCWLLHMAHGLTYAEIGDKLGLSRYTVRVFVERARSKAQQRFAE